MGKAEPRAMLGSLMSAELTIRDATSSDAASIIEVASALPDWFTARGVEHVGIDIQFQRCLDRGESHRRPPREASDSRFRHRYQPTKWTLKRDAAVRAF